MEKKEIIVVVLAIFLGTCILFWYDIKFSMAFLGLALIINILFNGLKYYNRTYFLLNFIIIFMAFLIILYDYISLNSFNNWYSAVFIILLTISLVRDYKNRESNSKIPWKNEW